MRLLITGGSGLLGSNLALEGAKNGLEVTAVHNRHSSPPGIVSHRLDLTKANHVSDFIQHLKPNCIVHCAAQTNVDWCEKHPKKSFDINAMATRHLACFAQRVGAHLIYISTDAVYDGLTGNYTEESPPAPINVYAASKLAGEEAIREILGDSALVLRTNIYGWNRQAKTSLAEWVLETLSARQKLQGFSDVVSSPLLVNDLASVIFALIRSESCGCLNAGSIDSCSKYDFARHLASVFSLPEELIEKSSIESINLQAPRPRNTSLNTDKLSQRLGYSPPDILSGLCRFKNLQGTDFLRRLKTVE